MEGVDESKAPEVVMISDDMRNLEEAKREGVSSLRVALASRAVGG